MDYPADETPVLSTLLSSDPNFCGETLLSFPAEPSFPSISAAILSLTASAAAVLTVSVKWVYRLVIVFNLCPTKHEMTESEYPNAAAIEANVCRKPCGTSPSNPGTRLMYVPKRCSTFFEACLFSPKINSSSVCRFNLSSCINFFAALPNGLSCAPVFVSGKRKS